MRQLIALVNEKQALIDLASERDKLVIQTQTLGLYLNESIKKFNAIVKPKEDEEGN